MTQETFDKAVGVPYTLAMTTTRFQTTGEEYLPGDHANVITAVAEVEPGHTVTRTWAWMDHYGPVPGSHYTEYRCTCGGRFNTTVRPHGSHLANIRHFADEAERLAFEAEEAAMLERIMRQLGGE